MDDALKLYLRAIGENGGDLWVATNGVIISGRISGIEEFFVYAWNLSGEYEQIFASELEKVNEENNVRRLATGEERKDPMILFARANIYINENTMFTGCVAVDPDNIGAWGPGLLKINKSEHRE
jgi:hypothetical protein